MLALNQHFYVLAFSPQSADRGKSRKLSIKVKRPGLSLSYRASYTLPDPKKLDPARTAAESSEIIAKGISGGPIRLTAYALPYRAKDGAAALPVVVQISPDAVADVAKRKQVGLQIFGYLVDGKGVVQDYFQATPTLDPTQTAEPLKRAGLQLITTFAASPGASEVRILVRDPAAATWGALRVPVEIPDFSASQKGFISNPMIVDDPFSRLALPTTTQRRPNREIPFRLDDRAFTVESDPVLKRGTAREVCVYLAPATGSTPSFEVSLVAASGSKVAQRPEKARVVRDADGFDRLVFFISPQGVEPGDYALSVTAGGQTASFPVRIQ